MKKAEILKHVSKLGDVKELVSISGGKSGARLFVLSSTMTCDWVVKVEEFEQEEESLLIESDLLNWLSQRVFVPQVVDVTRLIDDNSTQFEIFTMTKLSGQNLKSLRTHVEPDEIVRVYACALKALHTLPIAMCPVKPSLSNRLLQATERVDKGLVDVGDFEPEYSTTPIQDLIDQLYNHCPPEDDMVCAHGDYCLDNVMALMNKDSTLTFTGMVDMARGGVQDRYQDLALAIRSVKNHLGQDYITSFIKHYELVKDLDWNKINYYILLDEFF